MTKKNIAIGLVAIWAMLILYRLFFQEQSELRPTSVSESKQELAIQKNVEEKNVKYPEVTGYRFKKDLFADLIRDVTVKNVEKENKTEAKPAPPLPLLPSQPEIVREDKKEIKVDKLNDIVLLGIMDKKEKRFAFLKKGNDIKSLKKMDKLFDTDYIIEKITKTEVVLVDGKGNIRILKLDKEVHNDKKE